MSYDRTMMLCQSYCVVVSPVEGLRKKSEGLRDTGAGGSTEAVSTVSLRDPRRPPCPCPCPCPCPGVDADNRDKSRGNGVESELLLAPLLPLLLLLLRADEAPGPVCGSRTRARAGTPWPGLACRETGREKRALLPSRGGLGEMVLTYS